MTKAKTTEEFIEAAKIIHNDKYDYSKVEYKDSKTKVCIVCPKHGEFWQIPSKHLNGSGCRCCRNDKLRLTNEEFIRKANEVHSGKYDYTKTMYSDYHTKVCITCPKHGDFWQEPSNHLSGKGCRLCSRNSYNYTTDEWIKLASEIHKGRYDYSNVEYTKSSEKVYIVCPIHGGFWQIARNHLHGQGCPHCNESKLERYVNDVLEENKIVFERQKKFEWLGRQSVDFYLPSYNIAIECQGEQHFNPVDFGGNGEEVAEVEFERTVIRDKDKLQKLNDNNIRVIYVTKENKYNFLNFL